MADVRVTLKIGGIRQLLRSNEVQSNIAARAVRAARAAGTGFEAVVKPHRFTSRAYVQTADDEGRRREANEKVLIRVLDAMR